MEENRRRILLAVDGSQQAMDAVGYAASAFDADRTDVVLYHVYAPAPETFLDLKRDPEYRSDGLPLRDWSLFVHRNMGAFMDEAGRLLAGAGFAADRVARKMQRLRAGIARDILNESRQGYDALVAGRNGLGNPREAAMGGVAYKMAGSAGSVPVALVSGRPGADRILVGFDGSAGADRAVDLVCTLLAREDREVTLCHVVRSLGIHLNSDRVFLPEHERLWTDASRREIGPSIESAQERLIEAGFHPSRVYTKILENLASRASGIRAAAETVRAGTVVLGRRGLSEVEEFPMGMVPMKVIQSGGCIAAWIV